VETGGGFGGLVLPVGAYFVKGDQVRWVSAVDMTFAVLASLSLARVLSRTWTDRDGTTVGNDALPGTPGDGTAGPMRRSHAA